MNNETNAACNTNMDWIVRITVGFPHPCIRVDVQFGPCMGLKRNCACNVSYILPGLRRISKWASPSVQGARTPFIHTLYSTWEGDVL